MTNQADDSEETPQVTGLRRGRWRPRHGSTGSPVCSLGPKRSGPQTAAQGPEHGMRRRGQGGSGPASVCPCGCPARLKVRKLSYTEKDSLKEDTGCVTPSTALGAGNKGRPDSAIRSLPSGGKTGGTTKLIPYLAGLTTRPPRGRRGQLSGGGKEMRDRTGHVCCPGGGRHLCSHQVSPGSWCHPRGRPKRAKQRSQQRCHVLWTSRADFQGGEEQKGNGRVLERRAAEQDWREAAAEAATATRLGGARAWRLALRGRWCAPGLPTEHELRAIKTSSRPAARVFLPPWTGRLPSTLHSAARGTTGALSPQLPCLVSTQWHLAPSSAFFCAAEISSISNLCYLPAANVQAFFFF